MNRLSLTCRQYSDEFIVGLPNADKSITLTLFAPMDKMVGRYTVDNDGANKLRQVRSASRSYHVSPPPSSHVSSPRSPLPSPIPFPCTFFPRPCPTSSPPPRYCDLLPPSASVFAARLLFALIAAPATPALTPPLPRPPLHCNLQYLGEAYDDNLDTRADGLEDAVAGNFWSIWLNDHECLAKEVDDTGTFVFLFGDAALGMEQFLGLAVNLGFEGVHRVLEHYSREGPRDVDFYRGLARARNVHNAGAKALQQASSKNAASMRDGCDEPLGKAVCEALETAHGKTDINESGFESTHDWWSYCEIPLKVRCCHAT